MRGKSTSEEKWKASSTGVLNNSEKEKKERQMLVLDKSWQQKCS